MTAERKAEQHTCDCCKQPTATAYEHFDFVSERGFNCLPTESETERDSHGHDNSHGHVPTHYATDSTAMDHATETPSPEVGIDAFDFLDAAIDAGRGPVTFGMTDNGNVGVWIFDDADDAKAHGTGDTAEEALLDAAYRGTFPAILAAAKETK